MTQRPHTPPWSLGQESPRESKRFRFPVYSADDEWPWLAIFERERDARDAVARFNDYPRALRALARELRARQEEAALRDRLIAEGC